MHVTDGLRNGGVGQHHSCIHQTVDVVLRRHDALQLYE